MSEKIDFNDKDASTGTTGVKIAVAFTLVVCIVNLALSLVTINHLTTVEGLSITGDELVENTSKETQSLSTVVLTGQAGTGYSWFSDDGTLPEISQPDTAGGEVTYTFRVKPGDHTFKYCRSWEDTDVDKVMMINVE